MQFGKTLACGEYLERKVQSHLKTPLSVTDIQTGFILGGKKMERIALYNDSFQNWKTHDTPKAQLILTDIPYQLGNNMYGSNPVWYKGGDNSNGESELA